MTHAAFVETVGPGICVVLSRIFFSRPPGGSTTERLEHVSDLRLQKRPEDVVELIEGGLYVEIR